MLFFIMNRLLEYYSEDLYLRIENILLKIFHYIFYIKLLLSLVNMIKKYVTKQLITENRPKSAIKKNNKIISS